MRHANAGWKLQRNTSHRRAMLRNLVTSIIIDERVETTTVKAKAVRPLVEKMITLGKRGDLHARRQALAYLMTKKAVEYLFDTVAPRLSDREGGYTRTYLTGIRKGDGGQKAIIEIVGSEKVVNARREKRAAGRAKKLETAKKQMEAEGGKEEK